jgi:hypothetical protein
VDSDRLPVRHLYATYSLSIAGQCSFVSPLPQPALDVDATKTDRRRQSFTSNRRVIGALTTRDHAADYMATQKPIAGLSDYSAKSRAFAFQADDFQQLPEGIQTKSTGNQPAATDGQN